MVVRYTGWMTYKGGWFTIPANNQRVMETGIMIFKFKEGKITELWFENNDAAILYELGALQENSHKTFKMITSGFENSADNFFLSQT